MVTELNFVFTVAVDRTGMLTVRTTPFNFEILTNCPTLQVRIATVVLVPAVVATEQLDPELGTEHPERLQLTSA